MTTEQKLQAIIEVQVKGGYDGYPNFREPDIKLMFGPSRIVMRLPQGLGYQAYAYLEILLDPKGLRAAMNGKPMLSEGVAHEILDTWLSSNGDAAKTIDTAYSLLPNSHARE